MDTQENPYSTPEEASGKTKSCLIRGLLIAAGMIANLLFSWFLLMVTLEMDTALFFIGPGVLLLETLVGIYLLVKRKLEDFWLGVTIMAILLLLGLTACFGLLMNTNFH